MLCWAGAAVIWGSPSSTIPLCVKIQRAGTETERRFNYVHSQGRVGDRPKEFELQNGCFALQIPLFCLRYEGLEPFLLLSLAGFPIPICAALQLR